MTPFAKNLSGGGFGGLENTQPDIDDVDAVVLPAPYDGAASYLPGSRLGPSAIIQASAHVELYDAQWGVDCEQLRIATLNPVEPDVSGPGATISRIEKVYDQIASKAGFVLMLGGDHSLTTAPVTALANRFENNLTVVQFDAHADLRDTYQSSPHSHACVMRRVIERAGIVQIGLRNISREEAGFIKKSGHPVYPAWEISDRTDWIGSMLDQLSEHVYITVDLDCFDPSVVPGVGTPEPGGLAWAGMTEVIRMIGSRRKIVGADIMELAPIPGSVQSEFTAAKLGFKILAAALLSR